MDEISSALCFFGWVEVGNEGEGCRSGGWEESHRSKHCYVYSAERLLGYLRSAVGFADCSYSLGSRMCGSFLSILVSVTLRVSIRLRAHFIFFDDWCEWLYC